MNEEKIVQLQQGLTTAFINQNISSNLAYKPQFVSNNYKEGRKVMGESANADSSDLKETREYLKFKYEKVIADAGYESEENYFYLEKNGQLCSIV